MLRFFKSFRETRCQEARRCRHRPRPDEMTIFWASRAAGWSAARLSSRTSRKPYTRPPPSASCGRFTTRTGGALSCRPRRTSRSRRASAATTKLRQRRQLRAAEYYALLEKTKSFRVGVIFRRAAFLTPPRTDKPNRGQRTAFPHTPLCALAAAALSPNGSARQWRTHPRRPPARLACRRRPRIRRATSLLSPSHCALFERIGR